jgi:hypothetical protein
MREACGCGSRSVGGMGSDEPEQVEERTLAEDIEQQRGGGEVALLEEGVQRQLRRCERVGGLSAGERALGEHLDVTGLVVDVAAEP